MTITIKGNGATLIGAKNPVYANPEKTSVWVDAKFSHYADLGMTENDGYYKFLCNPHDPEEHGREMLTKALAGEYGTVGDYVAPEGE
tara:strand:+ start:743 stop:1003 length:261 start_codon:yes stop_codon:yes gene_type:complete